MEPQVPKAELISQTLKEKQEKMRACTQLIEDKTTPKHIRMAKESERNQLNKEIGEINDYIREHRLELECVLSGYWPLNISYKQNSPVVLTDRAR